MSTSKLLFPMRSIGYIMAGESNEGKILIYLNEPGKKLSFFDGDSFL